MPFLALTSDGLTVVCFLAEHDWKSKYAASHFWADDLTAGLSNRENRYLGAEAMLLSIGVRIVTEDDEAQALRDTFATLGKAWVGLPLLIDRFLGADYATAGARAYAPQRFLDLTAPAIVAAGDLVADHLYAPLVVGHITQLPPIEPEDEGMSLCSVVLTEDSPWTFRLGAALTIPATAWPVSLVPDWTTSPTQTPVHGLTFDRIGSQRERTIADEERAFVWSSEAGFSLTTRGEFATLLGFFVANCGRWGSFDAPLWYTPGTPTSAAPHQTKMRFAEETLKVEWTSEDDAAATVKLIEVPWEIAGTAGETPQQPPLIYLYQITYDVPTPYVWRFTNCWRPLTVAGDGTYQPGPWLHENMVGGTDLSAENLTLNSFAAEHDPAAHPFALFNPDILEGRLWLRVFACESWPIDPAAAELKWYGSIDAAPQEGRAYTAECAWLGGILDREIPGVRFGPNCNTWWLSSRCGHLKSAWAKAGTLASSVGNVVVITAADAAAANTYAPGKIELGAGLTYESRRITASAPVAGGQQLTLDRPLRQAAAGQAVTYLLVCDRTVARCQALDPTGWKPRFRGHPNAPQVSLSLPSNTSVAAGAKK